MLNNFFKLVAGGDKTALAEAKAELSARIEEKTLGIVEAARGVVLEQTLNELSPKTLGRYINKSTEAHGDAEYNMGKHDVHADNASRTNAKTGTRASEDRASYHIHKAGEAEEKSFKRKDGVELATKKLVKKAMKEDALNELSVKTLGGYIKKAHVSGEENGRHATATTVLAPRVKDQKWTQLSIDRHNKVSKKREDGINRAANKIISKVDAVKKAFREDVEPINELHPKTYASYIRKSHIHSGNLKDASSKHHAKADMARSTHTDSYELDRVYADAHREKGYKIDKKVNKRTDGIVSATRRLVKKASK